MDSEYFRGAKTIQRLGYHTKIRLWYCDSTLNVYPGSNTTQEWGCLWKQQARWNSSFSGQKGIRTPQPIHFRLVDVDQEYLSPVLEAHEEPNTWSLHRSFYKTLPHQIILRVPTLLPPAGNSRVTGGTPICLLAARDTQALQTHRASAPSAAAALRSSKQGGHSSHRTSLSRTRTHLWRNHFYLTSITKIQAMTWLNSPQHTYQHPCCFIWGGWLRSMPSASSRVRHCTASPELAEAGICSKLEAQLQWHLTNGPVPGALLLFPGRYPDWQGARNLKNRCLGLLCYRVFNNSSQERRWNGRARGWGRQRSAPFLKDTAQNPAPRPHAQLGTASANWVTHFKQAMGILQPAPARFLPAFRKYWFIIFIIK